MRGAVLHAWPRCLTKHALVLEIPTSLALLVAHGCKRRSVPFENAGTPLAHDARASGVSPSPCRPDLSRPAHIFHPPSYPRPLPTRSASWWVVKTFATPRRSSLEDPAAVVVRRPVGTGMRQSAFPTLKCWDPIGPPHGRCRRQLPPPPFTCARRARGRAGARARAAHDRGCRADRPAAAAVGA